jgi:uncharacterized PurR-regulated membrane protein YhhQ (DUF165 family)
MARPDEWLIRQRELPGRPKLSDRRLYRRRERVFLILGALFLVATAIAPLLGASKVFGAARPLREIGLSISTQLLLPVGVVALPLGLLALNLACELFGRRRAFALVLTGLVTWIGLVGLAWVTDHLADFDNNVTQAFGPSVAFAVACFATSFVQVEIFEGLGRVTRGRHLWLRNILGSAIGLAVGWVGFAMLVAYVPRAALPPLAGVAPDVQMSATAIASAAYTFLGIVVGTIVLYIAANPLANVLRIERYQRIEVFDDDVAPRRAEPAFAAPRPKPKAQLVESSPGPSRAGRSGASNSRPFTRDEVAFFNEGEELARDDH